MNNAELFLIIRNLFQQDACCSEHWGLCAPHFTTSAKGSCSGCCVNTEWIEGLSGLTAFQKTIFTVKLVAQNWERFVGAHHLLGFCFPNKIAVSFSSSATFRVVAHSHTYTHSGCSWSDAAWSPRCWIWHPAWGECLENFGSWDVLEKFLLMVMGNPPPPACVGATFVKRKDLGGRGVYVCLKLVLFLLKENCKSSLFQVQVSNNRKPSLAPEHHYMTYNIENHWSWWYILYFFNKNFIMGCPKGL